MKSTIKQLFEMTHKFDENDLRFSSAGAVRFRRGEFKVVPYKGTKSVVISGVTENGWQSTMALYGIEIVEETDNKHPVRIQYQGDDFFAEKFSYAGTPVRIRCSCPDFFFTGAYWVKHNIDALYGGALKQYTRKTETRPERNPQHIPMMCKHLIALTEYMKNSGFMKP